MKIRNKMTKIDSPMLHLFDKSLLAGCPLVKNAGANSREYFVYASLKKKFLISFGRQH